MLNHITIMGRLVKDPELRRTGSGIAVASFTLAVDRDFKSDNGEKETDFIDVVAWRNTGEFASKYLSKGRMAVVSGRLQIRSWTDKDGNKRKSAEVVTDNVYFADSKKDGGGDNGGSTYAAPGGSSGLASTYGNGYPCSSPDSNGYGGYPAPATVSEFASLEDDDGQLPF